MGKPVTPLLTVDVIIEVAGGVVLIERKNPPPGWALPGGFVDPGESLATAARREAMEETSLDVTLTELLAFDPQQLTDQQKEQLAQSSLLRELHERIPGRSWPAVGDATIHAIAESNQKSVQWPR